MFDSKVNERLWEFFLQGGVFMVFIVMCSFVAIAVGIHRWLNLKWKVIIPSELRGSLHRCGERFAQGEASQLLAALKRSNSPVGKVGRIVMSPEFADREAASTAAEATAREQMVRLEKGMGVLEVVITIAPLLGLLGTVSGLVEVFGVFGAQEGEADPNKIASGIAVALNTTIAGLVVAVITVIMHSFFVRRLERIAARLEVIGGHLLNEFYRHGGPALYPDEETVIGAEFQPDPELVQAIDQNDRLPEGREERSEFLQ